MVNAVTNIDQGFPQIQAPLVNPDRTINPIWLNLFTALWNRTGMGRGISSSDAIDFATLTENRLAIPIPNVDTDSSISAALATQPGSTVGAVSGFEGDLVISSPAQFVSHDSLEALLFMPASGPPGPAGTTVVSGGMLPLVNGDLPGPGIMADGLGQCVGVAL